MAEQRAQRWRHAVHGQVAAHHQLRQAVHRAPQRGAQRVAACVGRAVGGPQRRHAVAQQRLVGGDQRRRFGVGLAGRLRLKGALVIDAGACRALASGGSLPLLTIGGQQLKGYSDSEWTQYLDAAGYPKTSQLPSSYRRPAAAPLVAARATPAPAASVAEAASAPAAPAQPSVAPPRSSTNPTGIRF